MKKYQALLLAGLWAFSAGAQTVLFDFDNLPRYSGLPSNLTVAGVTAHFSATGQGFSIQDANTMGFTPVGFSGNCIYPSSVYAADLIVTFSVPLTDASILYAPQELACDSSATMRMSAYASGVLVGSSTTNAAAGTWPTETLEFSSSTPFDKIVVHYDAPPVTGGDWGPIFMADNLRVIPVPQPITLAGATRLAGGAFQFTFNATPGVAFTVLAATNLPASSLQWTALGSPAETAPGQYLFMDSEATGFPQRFYRISQP